MAQQKNEFEPINTIIGEGTKFNGEFEIKGAMRIDGTFSGKILSEGKVIVGPGGHVKTNIEANMVIVAGRVDGNIYALESVHLLDTAHVYGDIVSPNLVVDSGVVFEGRARVSKTV